MPPQVDTTFIEKNGRTIVLERTRVYNHESGQFDAGTIVELKGRKRREFFWMHGYSYDRKLKRWVDPLAEDYLDDWADKWLAARG